MNDGLHDALQPGPPGRAQPMFYRQGRVIEWNPATAESLVDVDGVLIENMPILNTSEALLLRPDSVVAIAVVGSTWGILGRMIIPGTDDAASALSAIGAVTDKITTSQSTGSTSFTDLATVGPQVTVQVGPSGRLLSIVSATIAKSGTAFFGAMGVQLSGVNSAAPDLNESLRFEGLQTPGCSRVVLHTGLSPGNTTVTAKYIADANSVFFSGRTLAVIAL